MHSVAEAVPDAARQSRSVTRVLEPARLGDHFDRLFRAAWALSGSREDAEDLVQETYARVLRERRLLRGGDDLGYLLRTLRNTYYSQVRAAGARIRPDALPDDLDRVQDRGVQDPATVLEGREVYAAIAALPDPFREALVAVDVAGLSYREAAQAFRVREATLTTRLYRARQRVAQTLGAGKDGGGAGVMIERGP
ncbi:MAG: RNA polymerase sigma factor [Thermoleophilaceae bacterium]